MKLHIRCDSHNSQHAHLTLFIDGKNNGKLCVSPAESIWLHHILSKGCEALSPVGKKAIAFVSSGSWPEPNHTLIDAVVS